MKVFILVTLDLLRMRNLVQDKCPLCATPVTQAMRAQQCSQGQGDLSLATAGQGSEMVAFRHKKKKSFTSEV